MPPVDPPPAPPDSPFDRLLGVEVDEATAERVRLTLPVTDRLHQPAGLVHGGVYAALVETAASLGAQLALGGDGIAVGIANHTDFLRPARGDRLHAEALPVAVGRTLQLWHVRVTDGERRLVASGQVRLTRRSEQAGAR